MGTFPNNRPIPVPDAWREAMADIGQAAGGAEVDPDTLTDELVGLLAGGVSFAESELVYLTATATGTSTQGLIGTEGGDGGVTQILTTGVGAAIADLDNAVQSQFGVLVDPLTLTSLAAAAETAVVTARASLEGALTLANSMTPAAIIPSQILEVGVHIQNAVNFAAAAEASGVLDLTPGGPDTISVRLDAISDELGDLVDLVDTIVTQTSAVPAGTSLRAKLTAIAAATV